MGTRSAGFILLACGSIYGTARLEAALSGGWKASLSGHTGMDGREVGVPGGLPLGLTSDAGNEEAVVITVVTVPGREA